MTKRQANTLRALAYAEPFVLSASERGDAVMYTLIRMNLAQGWRMNAGGTICSHGMRPWPAGSR